MAKITRVKYFTEDKIKLINQDNIKLYEKYLRSSIIKNKEVETSTYYVYHNYMTHFLVFLAEKYNNIGLYSQEMMENAVDILEDYIAFCQDTLMNNKKIINTKLSTISSFYIWSMKRKLIPSHPFDKKLDRMKGASDEKIINSYFLTPEQIQIIRQTLISDDNYDIQDQLLFEIFIESANRVGAIEKLTLSSMDIDNLVFKEIREKRGYRVEVLFSEQAKLLIDEWLLIRKDMDNLTVDALWITRYRKGWKQMSKSTIQERIKKIGKIVGIEDFHCHCLRKSKLNDIYETTGDLSLASAYANHKGTDVTLLYVKPKSKTELREKIEKLKHEKEEKKTD